MLTQIYSRECRLDTVEDCTSTTRLSGSFKAAMGAVSSSVPVTLSCGKRTYTPCAGLEASAPVLAAESSFWPLLLQIQRLTDQYTETIAKLGAEKAQEISTI